MDFFYEHHDLVFLILGGLVGLSVMCVFAAFFAARHYARSTVFGSPQGDPRLQEAVASPSPPKPKRWAEWIVLVVGLGLTAWLVLGDFPRSVPWWSRVVLAVVSTSAAVVFIFRKKIRRQGSASVIEKVLLSVAICYALLIGLIALADHTMHRDVWADIAGTQTPWFLLAPAGFGILIVAMKRLRWIPICLFVLMLMVLTNELNRKAAAEARASGRQTPFELPRVSDIHTIGVGETLFPATTFTGPDGVTELRMPYTYLDDGTHEISHFVRTNKASGVWWLETRPAHGTWAITRKSGRNEYTGTVTADNGGRSKPLTFITR